MCTSCETHNIPCCEICNCISVTSTSNTINVNKQGCNIDLNIDGSALQNLIKINSSSCITVITELIDGKLVFTPTFNTSCITITPPLFIAENGLYKTGNAIRLGGTLIEDTDIDVDVFDFTISQNSGSQASFKPDETSFNQTLGTSYSNTLCRIRPYEILNQSNYIRSLATQVSLTSGSLIAGKRYIITGNSGGADFTACSATTITNAIGTIFVSNGVTPTWGTGSLEPLSQIVHTAPDSSHTIDQTGHILLTQSRNGFPYYDLGAITVLQPHYYETQLFDLSQRGLTSYITEGVVVIKSKGNLDEKYTKVGVSVPTTNDPAILAPSNTQYTAYTAWKSNPTLLEKGSQTTVADTASFVGNISTVKVGINTTTPERALDIDEVSSQASLRIRNAFVPASATAIGKTGDISWGNSGGVDYLYICVATNTWKRVALATF